MLYIFSNKVHILCRVLFVVGKILFDFCIEVLILCIKNLKKYVCEILYYLLLPTKF